MRISRRMGLHYSLGPPPPPASYVYQNGYTASATFTAPENNWYRIHAWGRSGNGAAGGRAQTSASVSNRYGGYGGAGGSTGGFSSHMVWMKAGQTLTITINTTSTTVVNAQLEVSMTANAATNASSQTNPGTPGTATGGNIVNLSGAKGGNGGIGGENPSSINGNVTTLPTAGIQGGNTGAAGGTKGNTTSQGGGGGGGARAVGQAYCSYVAANMSGLSGGSGVQRTAGSPAPSITVGSGMKVTGAGSGGGGGVAGETTYNGAGGGAGQNGVVIVERGVA